MNGHDTGDWSHHRAYPAARQWSTDAGQWSAGPYIAAAAAAQLAAAAAAHAGLDENVLISDHTTHKLRE